MPKRPLAPRKGRFDSIPAALAMIRSIPRIGILRRPVGIFWWGESKPVVFWEATGSHHRPRFAPKSDRGRWGRRRVDRWIVLRPMRGCWLLLVVEASSHPYPLDLSRDARDVRQSQVFHCLRVLSVVGRTTNTNVKALLLGDHQKAKGSEGMWYSCRSAFVLLLLGPRVCRGAQTRVGKRRRGRRLHSHKGERGRPRRSTGARARTRPAGVRHARQW